MEATMTKVRIVMLGLIVAVVVAFVAATPSAQTVPASTTQKHTCSIATIAGAWVFTTHNLYQQNGMLDGNALGTANYGKDGSVRGKYDWAGTSGFYPGNSYVGTVTVNPDCTGTISQHDVGSDVIILQSIVISDGGREIWGMFQDPTNDVGTFTLKRVSEKD
jgi:hypothetical protein